MSVFLVVTKLSGCAVKTNVKTVSVSVAQLELRLIFRLSQPGDFCCFILMSSLSPLSLLSSLASIRNRNARIGFQEIN